MREIKYEQMTQIISMMEKSGVNVSKARSGIVAPNKRQAQTSVQ